MKVLLSLVKACVVAAIFYSSYLSYRQTLLLVELSEGNELNAKANLANAAVMFHMGTYTVACFHNTKDDGNHVTAFDKCEECKRILEERVKLLLMSQDLLKAGQEDSVKAYVNE